MNTHAALKAYANAGLESSVSVADPHKLIVLLYQGAILAVIAAKNHLLRKEISAKGSSISKAIMIIEDGLKASLDQDSGGELAKNLASLYDYMSQRLLEANAKNDPAMMDEVARLLTDLKGAWESIRPTSATTSAPVATPGSSASSKQAALVYGRI